MTSRFSHRLFPLLAVGLGLAATCPKTVLGVTISFQEGVSPTPLYTHDATYIHSSAPNTNQNASGSNSLIVGEQPGGFFNVAHSILEFDLSAIQDSTSGIVTIENVSLVLFNRGTNDGFTGVGNSITVSVADFPTDFNETTATWNTFSPPGGDTSGTLLSQLTFDPTPGASGGDVVFASTPAFAAAAQAAIDGDAVVRMILFQAAGDPGFARFYNDELGAPAALRPELIVEFSVFVPEPSSGLLFAGFGFVLTARRRRKRR